MSSPTIHPEYASIIEKYTANKPADIAADPLEDPDVQDAANADRFGFYHPGGVNDKRESEEKKQCQARRVEKWREMTDHWEEIDSMWQRMFRNGHASEKLTRRIFKGIPQQFRMIVWPMLLCVPEVKMKNKNVYSRMLKRALATSNDLGQIDLDINRTFRNTTYFRARYGSRQQALFRILAAYSVYNSEVGYCQGMSEIVGLLLTYIIEEEDVFWALSQLMIGSRHRVHGIFVSGFPGLQRLFAHHERIMKRLVPALDKHFNQQQVVTSTYALKWFMQCFLDRLPVSLVLRLWDIYLLEGEKILIAMAYNILKMHKKRLLRMDQTQITCFFQDELPKNFYFEDDLVIDSLKDCIEQLRRNKLDQPPPPTDDMLPHHIGGPPPDAVWQNQPINSAPSPSPAKQERSGPVIKSPSSPATTPDGNLFSPPSSTHIPSGYATTDSRRHRAARENMIYYSSGFGPYSQNINVIESTSPSSPSSANGVRLLSVRPRKPTDHHEAAADKLAGLMVEHLRVDSPISRPRNNQDDSMSVSSKKYPRTIEISRNNRWASEQVVYPPDSGNRPAQSGSSSNSILDERDQPWHRRQEFVADGGRDLSPPSPSTDRFSEPENVWTPNSRRLSTTASRQPDGTGNLVHLVGSAEASTTASGMKKHKDGTNSPSLRYRVIRIDAQGRAIDPVDSSPSIDKKASVKKKQSENSTPLFRSPSQSRVSAPPKVPPHRNNPTVRRINASAHRTQPPPHRSSSLSAPDQTTQTTRASSPSSLQTAQSDHCSDIRATPLPPRHYGAHKLIVQTKRLSSVSVQESTASVRLPPRHPSRRQLPP
ncbi:unnamed protein product [Calicophoron daubneyi]|uniref:Rab-GAP TBC domain-containing protein n=1 Tax=Calicophoron daubneyi TaxID=300641 RepID=A0AAV2T7D4_CALDB